MFVLIQMEGVNHQIINVKVNKTYSNVRTNADSMKWPIVIWTGQYEERLSDPSDLTARRSKNVFAGFEIMELNRDASPSRC